MSQEMQSPLVDLATAPTNEFQYLKDLETFRNVLDQVISDENSEPEVTDALKEAMGRFNQTLFGFGQDFSFDDPILVHALYAFRTPERVLLSTKEAMRYFRQLPGEDLSTHAVGWLKVGIRIMVIRYLGLRDESFQRLSELTPRELVEFRTNLHLAIFGDAGYSGLPQDTVKGLIRAKHAQNPFDALIHLGDVYFAASLGDILDHFLRQFRNVGAPPYRLFAVPGNHDLYYGGQAFADAIQDLPQPGRYFLITTPDWRIVCMDTASGDGTFMKSDGLLDDVQLDWFKDIVADQDSRPIILLSHHYFVSAWNRHGGSLEQQIGPLVRDKVFAWYWGHEHGCATYHRGKHGFYGACVGNGAFPEEYRPPTNVAIGLDEFPDPKSRCSCFGRNDGHWPHGFLELELESGKLRETFHIENSTKPWTRQLLVKPTSRKTLVPRPRSFSPRGQRKPRT